MSNKTSVNSKQMVDDIKIEPPVSPLWERFWAGWYQNRWLWWGSLVTGLFTVGFLVVGIMFAVEKLYEGLKSLRERPIKQLLAQYYQSHRGSMSLEGLTLENVADCTPENSVTPFENYEDPTLEERKRRLKEYGQLALQSLHSQTPYRDYQKAFILHCMGFTEIQQLDFSAFRCTNTGAKRRQYNHFLKTLLRANPHIIELAFHSEDEAYIDENIRQILRSHQRCHSIEHARENLGTPNFSWETLQSYYLDTKIQLKNACWEISQLLLSQLYWPNFPEKKAQPFDGNKNDFQQEFAALNTQAKQVGVPLEEEQKRRPFLWEINYFYNVAYNMIIKIGKTMSSVANDPVSTHSTVSGTDSTISYQRQETAPQPSQAEEKKELYVNFVTSGTSPEEKQAMLEAEAMRICQVWKKFCKKRPKYKHPETDPGPRIDPELNKTLYEIFYGKNTFEDNIKREREFLGKTRVMDLLKLLTADRHPDNPIFTEAMTILNPIFTVYKTWCNSHDKTDSGDTARIVNRYLAENIKEVGWVGLEDRKKILNKGLEDTKEILTQSVEDTKKILTQSVEDRRECKKKHSAEMEKVAVRFDRVVERGQKLYAELNSIRKARGLPPIDSNAFSPTQGNEDPSLKKEYQLLSSEDEEESKKSERTIIFAPERANENNAPHDGSQYSAIACVETFNAKNDQPKEVISGSPWKKEEKTVTMKECPSNFYFYTQRDQSTSRDEYSLIADRQYT